MNKSVSLDAYQKLADYYFHHVDEKPANADYERPGTLSLLPDVESIRVLDAGCGAGWYTQWLIEKGAAVTSIDFSPNMVKLTKQRVGQNAKVYQANLSEPLTMIERNTYDLIVSPLTLHYIKDWDVPFKEFNRVLRERGRLVFSVHHPFMDYTQFNCENYFATELLEDTWKIPEGEVKVHFYRRPLTEIIKPLYLNGFTIEKIIEPMPTEKYREKSPDSYAELTKKPQFLFVRAQKIMSV
ncbi:class I SAM-dependent methyltransferase [Alkalihalobacillus sp. AL-G]|uniref:class I SAM-dependent methyltransferase n=1 Tax=Alkalihalobacillus sp. AL-G TaxID=2926399 RepID=UPI00272B9D58|nr:class I SAM-dependent methyltransferase [Alkalihalobacillus sp. AL-G]WLD91577.1 class I SAM-dependent methyltransferase [Alkalihalobacillus sp. AL-G]